MSSTTMRTNPLRGFFSIFSSNAARLLLGLAITPLLVRVLGSGSYGDYAFLLSVLGISMILVNAGITDGIRKFVAEAPDDDEWADAVYAFYCRLGAGLAVSGGFILVVSNISGVTSALLGEEFIPYLYLLAFLIVARQGLSVVRSSLMGKGLEHLSEPLRVIEKLLFGVFGLLLAYIGFGVSGVLAGHIIGVVIVLLVGAYILRYHYTLSAPVRSHSVSVPTRGLLTFNVNSVVLILLTASLYHVDILFIQFLVGSEATGHYKAALIVVEFLWFVPFALQLVLLHSASELWSKQHQERVSEIAGRVTRYTLFFTLLLAIGIAALAEPFVRVYFGSPFLPAVTPLWLLLPGALGFAIARPIFAIGQGRGTLRPLLIATGAAAAVNLLLNLILIPRYGMEGAAIATSVGYGSMLLFHIAAARKIGYNPIADLRLFRVGATGVACAAIVLPLTVATGVTLISLLIVPPVGFVVYLVVGLRIRAIDPGELIQLMDSLPDALALQGTRLIRLIS